MDEDKHSVTLNIPNDLSPGDWQSLVEVYKAMPDWVDGSGTDGYPIWWLDGIGTGMIGAPIEPSGLLISGNVSRLTWSR